MTRSAGLATTATEAAISAPGTALGRFRIDGTLGRGGMAVVHLAYDTELGRPVALKLMADHCADDAAFRARFAREARAAARLSHPNIVQVFDIGEEAGLPFIVMEYVEGETLGDTLARERRVAPERAVEIARECCAGLACAHAAGLVHRDIKPQNLLVTTDGTIKIADFGVAHALDQTRLTLTGSIVGTARYLAPEQTTGGPITPAADVYALGVVLYELLAGRPPHEGTSLPELAIAKRDDPVTPLVELRPEVGRELDAAVLACLAVSADERPTADGLAARLTPVDLDEQPTVVRAPTAATPPRSATRARGSRPRRVIAAAIAAAIVAVVLAFVVGSLRSHPAAPAPPTAPTGPTPAEHAHNLAEWIRGHSR
jgi:serine/threonine-protein kinase